MTLTLDDLLPLDEYAGRRGEFFDVPASATSTAIAASASGRSSTLVFENRQTLWFRVQEVLRDRPPGRARPRAAGAGPVQPPAAGPGPPAGRPADRRGRVAPGRGAGPLGRLRGDRLTLQRGPARTPANLLTCRPEDRCIGAAHWVQFILDRAGRQLLADLARPAFFAAVHGPYRHQSPILSDEVRQSPSLMISSCQTRMDQGDDVASSPCPGRIEPGETHEISWSKAGAWTCPRYWLSRC